MQTFKRHGSSTDLSLGNLFPNLGRSSAFLSSLLYDLHLSILKKNRDGRFDLVLPKFALYLRPSDLTTKTSSVVI